MRKTVRALFDSPELLQVEDVRNSESLKSLLKTYIPASIEESFILGKQYASIFEINDSGNFIDIHKRYWVEALETCLLWYADSEDYEMCTHIKKLILAIQEKKGRKLKVNKKESDDGL